MTASSSPVAIARNSNGATRTARRPNGHARGRDQRRELARAAREVHLRDLVKKLKPEQLASLRAAAKKLLAGPGVPIRDARVLFDAYYLDEAQLEARTQHAAAERLGLKRETFNRARGRTAALLELS